MFKVAAVLAFLFSAAAYGGPSSFPSPTASTHSYVRVSCMVYLSSDSEKVIASPSGSLISGQEFLAYRMGKLDYTVGVAETSAGMLDVLHQMILTIRRNGRVISQSTADFEPGRSTNVSIATEPNLPTMNCTNVN